MRCGFALVPLIALAWLPATAQQNAGANRPLGAEVAAPVLLPATVAVSTPKHCEELDSVVKFTATIDTAGVPRELKALEASDRRLTGFATEIAQALRFKPASMDGSPTAVPVGLTVGLHTCAEREKHSADGHFYDFTLRAHPLIALAVVEPPAPRSVAVPVSAIDSHLEHVGGHIIAPNPTVLIDPQVPVSGKLPKRGHCYLGLTIDANGIPQNVQVVRGLEPELDSYAVEAAKNWRFRPALRDGRVPTAFEGTVVATFENVDKEPVAFANFISEPPNLAIHARGDRFQHLKLEPVNADEVVARYMPHSRIAGRCLVSLVVDPNGIPQNVHIVKGLDSSLDMDTVAMIEHLRFKPVLVDGTTPAYVGVVMPVRYRGVVEKLDWRNVFFDLAEIPFLLMM